MKQKSCEFAKHAAAVAATTENIALMTLGSFFFFATARSSSSTSNVIKSKIEGPFLLDTYYTRVADYKRRIYISALLKQEKKHMAVA